MSDGDDTGDGRPHLRLVRETPTPGDSATGAGPDPAAGDPPAAPVLNSGTYPPGTFGRLFDLTDQVAVVVGAGGIGSAIAAALADHGARIAVADRDIDAAKRLAQACLRPGRPGPIALILDITNPAQAKAAVQAVEQTTGKIDILVNAAGIQIGKPALDYAPNEWRQILDVNLSGVFYITQAIGAGMVARGYGRVVTIASVSSLLGHPNHAPYAASKGGVALLTKVLATEWAPHGVTVNAIGPTYIETALSAPELARPGIRDGIVSRIPMGRLGTPEDLVSAAVFLCSESARFVTGQTLYVDGGRTAD